MEQNAYSPDGHDGQSKADAGAFKDIDELATEYQVEQQVGDKMRHPEGDGSKFNLIYYSEPSSSKNEYNLKLNEYREAKRIYLIKQSELMKCYEIMKHQEHTIKQEMSPMHHSFKKDQNVKYTNSLTIIHNRLNSTSKLEGIIPFKHNQTEIKIEEQSQYELVQNIQQIRAQSRNSKSRQPSLKYDENLAFQGGEPQNHQRVPVLLSSPQNSQHQDINDSKIKFDLKLKLQNTNTINDIKIYDTFSTVSARTNGLNLNNVAKIEIEDINYLNNLKAKIQQLQKVLKKQIENQIKLATKLQNMNKENISLKEQLVASQAKQSMNMICKVQVYKNKETQTQLQDVSQRFKSKERTIKEGKFNLIQKKQLVQKIKSRDGQSNIEGKSRNKFEKGPLENTTLRKSHKTCLTINFDLTSNDKKPSSTNSTNKGNQIVGQPETPKSALDFLPEISIPEHFTQFLQAKNYYHTSQASIKQKNATNQNNRYFNIRYDDIKSKKSISRSSSKLQNSQNISNISNNNLNDTTIIIEKSFNRIKSPVEFKTFSMQHGSSSRLKSNSKQSPFQMKSNENIRIISQFNNYDLNRESIEFKKKQLLPRTSNLKHNRQKSHKSQSATTKKQNSSPNPFEVRKSFDKSISRFQNFAQPSSTTNFTNNAASTLNNFKNRTITTSISTILNSNKQTIVNKNFSERKPPLKSRFPTAQNSQTNCLAFLHIQSTQPSHDKKQGKSSSIYKNIKDMKKTDKIYEPVKMQTQRHLQLKDVQKQEILRKSVDQISLTKKPK